MFKVNLCKHLFINIVFNFKQTKLQVILFVFLKYILNKYIFIVTLASYIGLLSTLLSYTSCAPL
nr:MAG TPA: hypothetical protein [Caudoviricetes sp.]DAS19303.1 MAG TPA: hypothetical protein [Caudoviricetes sp.]DAV02496.1 MAG TPA: hypothetical protein [Caudoviricetes sp.]